MSITFTTKYLKEVIIIKCNECEDIETSDAPLFNLDITWPKKPKGPAGSCVTDNYAYAANTIGSEISILQEGTNILLPNEQKLPVEYVTVDESNKVFTIKNAGTYFIKYTIYTTSTVSLGSRLIINGIENIESTINNGLSINKFSADLIINIIDNTQISLQMFGTGTIILLSNGVGAALSIIRLA